MSNPAPRFCHRCGESWQIEWSSCAACFERAHPLPLSPQGTGLGSALWLYFFTLACSVVGMVGASLHAGLTFLLACDVAFCIGVIIWCVAHRREILPLLLRIGGFKWLAVALVGGLITFAIAHTAVTFLARLFQVPILNYSWGFLLHGYGWAWVVLWICVEPAIFEELAFRGVILTVMQRFLTVRETVLVSALLFMIIHLSPLSMPHLLVLGLALGILRVRTGSLYPGIILHFTHNLMCIALERWPELMPW